MFLTDRDLEILEEIDKMPLMEALRYIGCDPREIKTPYGTLIILHDEFGYEN